MLNQSYGRCPKTDVQSFLIISELNLKLTFCLLLREFNLKKYEDSHKVLKSSVKTSEGQFLGREGLEISSQRLLTMLYQSSSIALRLMQSFLIIK